VTGAPDDKPTVLQKTLLLLGEMFPAQIAAELALRGVDCRAVVTDPVLRAQSDLEIFDAGVRDGRVIVTNNVTDFESLRRVREAVGGPVPGLIYTSDITFPRTRAYVSRLTAALAAVAADRETAACGGVLWLRSPG
jgi:predicted nuclease of predicted toxin-antitoxin system